MKEKCEICKYYSEDCSVIVVMNGYDDKEDYTGGCRKKSRYLLRMVALVFLRFQKIVGDTLLMRICLKSMQRPLKFLIGTI